MLPELTPDQHASAVHDELIESIQAMKKPAKSKLLKKVAKALRQISTNTMPATSEGERDGPPKETRQIQRVATPQVTTSTNPTDPRTMTTKPRSHQRITRANTPGMVPPIIPPELNQQPTVRKSRRLHNALPEDPIITLSTPNCSRIPFASSNIISQEAVNLLTTRSYYEDALAWTPDTDDFISSSPTSTDRKSSLHDADIEHFCAPVIHPVTGETISSYKKLAQDPITRDT